MIDGLHKNENQIDASGSPGKQRVKVPIWMGKHHSLAGSSPLPFVVSLSASLSAAAWSSRKKKSAQK